MNNLRQEYLISYDIEDTKIRTSLYKELLKLGMLSVQKSVFWGYITQADFNSICHFFKQKLKNTDKAFLTKSNLNGRGQSFFVGHQEKDFKDWDEYNVL